MDAKQTINVAAIDITLNPLNTELNQRPKAKNEESRNSFSGKAEGDLEKYLETLQAKTTGKAGLGANDAVDQGAVAKASTPLADLAAGSGAGGLLEMCSIAIGFAQNFGLVITTGVAWPESFLMLFSWIEIFSLDFEAFGGEQLRVWITIWTGLLLPPWLTLMFDVSWRTKFMLIFDEEGFIICKNNWGDDRYAIQPKIWVPVVIFLVIGSFSFAIACAMCRWDVLGAQFIIISSFLVLSILYQYYLYKLRITCDIAKEDFGKTRQQFEMFLFVFLYQVTHLSGVISCITMATMRAKTTSIIGCILLPFYVILAPTYLLRIGKRVKENLIPSREEILKKLRLKNPYQNRDEHKSDEELLEEADRLYKREVERLDYKARLEYVRQKAAQEIITDIYSGSEMEDQKLSIDSNGYKASVISGLFGSFQENFWWWKIFLMTERAALAILVYIGASSWSVVGVSVIYLLSILICQPYWSRAEDGLDIMVRTMTTLVCLAACLYQEDVVAEDEAWLTWVLNTVGCVTLATLVIFIGPVRLVKGAFKWYQTKRRAVAVRGGQQSIEKLSNAGEVLGSSFVSLHRLFLTSTSILELKEMTKEEFNQFSHEIKAALGAKFPTATTFRAFVKELEEKSKTFTNEGLRQAVKDWVANPIVEEIYGHISCWNVSQVTDMDDLFEDAKGFDEDIGGWNVSRVTTMDSMFMGASSFNGDISTWDVSNVTNMAFMFKDASTFNGDLSTWDVGKVAIMEYMFNKASAFDGDLSAWDISGVRDMNSMFYAASSFQGDLSSWNVSKVEDMEDMFTGASSFDKDCLKNWDLSSITDPDNKP